MKIDGSNVSMVGTSYQETTTKQSLSRVTIRIPLSELTRLIDKRKDPAKAREELDKYVQKQGGNKLTDEDFARLQKTAEDAAPRDRLDLSGNTTGSGKVRTGSIGAPTRFEEYLAELRRNMLREVMRLLEESGFHHGGKGGSQGYKIGGSSGLRQFFPMARTAQRADPVFEFSQLKMTQEVSHTQAMSFDMAAKVTTSDGRTIDVGISLNMSESFYKKNELTLSTARVQNMKDPLVINFDAPSAALTDQKFAFDLDNDGESDQISRLASGSGFLAVDWNEDGEVNDGSELFGTKSGDGFGDLAKFDQDGNGWIDENDDIFDKLRIWSHNEDGTSSLVGLGEKGIGAIFLGSVKTNYNLNADVQMNGSVQADGAIRSTGFFLRENGTAGTVQHVDLAV